MSREIKFRGWDKYDKKMIYDLCQIDSFWHYYSYSDNTGLHFGKTGPNGVGEDFENKYIMQYTGLKDKNGKEIYEGDIVSSYVQTGKESSRSIIVWEDEELYSGWNIKVIKDFYPPNQEGCIIPISRNDVMDYEVIGNIYENSELLEVE